MKAGLENRKQVAIMALLLVLAAFGLWRALGSDDKAKLGTGSAAKATATAPAARRGVLGRRWSLKNRTLIATLDPTLRLDLLKSSEEREYTGGKRNIFEPQSAVVVQKVAPPKLQPAQQQVYVPPPPPPINLKFYGFANKPGEARRIFLSSGDDVFIAAEGEIVDRHYRIVKITNSSVEIEDVLNNTRQTIPLTQG